MIFNRCYLLYALSYDSSKYTICTIWSTTIMNFIKWFHYFLILWNALIFAAAIRYNPTKKFHFQSNQLLFILYIIQSTDCEIEIVNNFLVKLSLFCFCSLWIAVTLFLVHTTQPNETIQCCHRYENNRLLCFFSVFLFFWQFTRIGTFVVATKALVSFCLRCEYSKSNDSFQTIHFILR